MGGLPSPFLKIEKMCPDFVFKNAVCVHLWLKFLFKMQFYVHLGEETQKFSLQSPSFCLVHEIFIEVLLLQEISPNPKISWLRGSFHPLS